MYFFRSFLIRPRMICLKRLWSCSILRIIVIPPATTTPLRVAEWPCGRGPAGASSCPPSVARVAAGEDAGHVVQDVRGADVAIAVVLLETALDDVDLLLRVLVHDRGDQRGQLDRILLVLEQLQLQRLVQTLVGLVVEGLALHGQGPDVVHYLAPEVLLAVL